MIHRIAFLLAAIALATAACGGSDGTTEAMPPSSVATTTSSSTTTTSEATTTTAGADVGFPVTIEAPNGPVTIEERPDRIVSISPTSTEVLFAIGAGDQVVAVDSLSNHPQGAPLTDLSAFSPNVEAIASYEPDLVLLSFDPDGGLIPALGALGIPAILLTGPVSVADAYAQWEQIGAVTGHVGEADALVASTTASIDAAYESLPPDSENLTYYWELDQMFYSVTSATFIGDLLSGAKMTNVADAADEDGYEYPQLSAEYIIGGDPDLILLADIICCGQSAESVAQRPGWNTMTAVRNGQIVELDDDIASRWGPRIAVLVDDVVSAVLEVTTNT
jgi:iron complex transport system substrate-binding protein